MSTHVNTEETVSTRSEKVLAVVLAIFLLIGTGWFYVKVDAWVGGEQAWEYTESEQAAIDAAMEADESSYEAEAQLEERRTDLELARDDLQLAIDQQEDTAGLRDAYDEAQEAFEQTREQAKDAEGRAQDAQKKADAAEQSYQDRNQDPDSQYWIVALLRLVFVAVLIGASLRLLTRQRARDSKYLALGLSAVVTSAVMAVVLAIDYVTDYIDVLELGPLVLSVLGAAATVAAFAALQRYLARRVPRSRVRKNECPFCGFPVRDRGPHCEGCGRDVVAECSNCGEDRRVGSPHCARCGSD